MKTLEHATRSRVRVVSGNEACAQAAVAAGCRFFGGYPITPSTEIAEHMARLLPPVGGKFIQMEDEMASLGAVLGASVTGVKAMTATSGPGFSLMQENIGYAAMAEIPCVIINVMRGGPSTGLPTKTSQADIMQSRWGSHGDYPVIALVPSNVYECFTLTIHAFNLSEKYRVPVIVLSDEIVGHAHENVVFPSPEEITIFNRIKPSVPPEEYVPYEDTPTGVPPMASFGDGYRYFITGLTHDEAGFPTSRPQQIDALLRRLKRKIDDNVSDIVCVEEFLLDDAEIVLVAFGSVARVAKAAVMRARSLGIRAGLLRLISLWPFPETQIRNLPNDLRAIIVPEMNFGQIVGEVSKHYRGKAGIFPHNRVDSELTTIEEILEQIEKAQSVTRPRSRPRSRASSPVRQSTAK